MSVKNSQKNLFCCWYVILGNIEEAAIKAGFDRETALYEGISYLKSSECRKTIEQLRKIISDKNSITSGLKRLAFGNCSDAVYLAFAEELPPPDVVKGLDLFNVSEIKRVKGGGVEIKLFDRMKALEKLYELENAFSERNTAENLIQALTSSVEGVDETDD